MLQILKNFMALEAASGLVLMAVAVVAMLLANSPLAIYYEQAFAAHGPASLAINDGLMVIFFLLVGLEIKREIVEGELSSWDKAILPVLAAVGGVVVPALIYSHFNMGTYAIKGWAIPAATDIAFSLGVLSLFGNKVPISLRVFLMALAVIDDLIAVLIIAIFYTENLNIPALCGAAACVALLWFLAKQKGHSRVPFLMLGVCLWLAVLLSGVHATIAGVLLGLLMPMQHNNALIRQLHAPVAYGIIPLFAFANAGVSLAGFSLEHIAQPVSLGIVLGLLLGKPIGIFLVSAILILFKWAKTPKDSSLLQLLAVSSIAGIGFTMSLFIAALASKDPEFSHQARLGIMTGSLLSGIVGVVLLAIACKVRR